MLRNKKKVKHWIKHLMDIGAPCWHYPRASTILKMASLDRRTVTNVFLTRGKLSIILISKYVIQSIAATQDSYKDIQV